MNDELVALRADLLTALARIDVLLQPKDLAGLPCTTAIEHLLKTRGPMRPVEIAKALREAGRDEPDHIVQVATSGLFHRGRIDRVSAGVYAAKLTGSAA